MPKLKDEKSKSDMSSIPLKSNDEKSILSACVCIPSIVPDDILLIIDSAFKPPKSIPLLIPSESKV